jgi:hypothetical protein
MSRLERQKAEGKKDFGLAVEAFIAPGSWI